MQERTDKNNDIECWELPKSVCSITLHCCRIQHMVVLAFGVMPPRLLLQEHFFPSRKQKGISCLLLESMTYLSE